MWHHLRKNIELRKLERLGRWNKNVKENSAVKLERKLEGRSVRTKRSVEFAAIDNFSRKLRLVTLRRARFCLFKKKKRTRENENTLFRSFSCLLQQSASRTEPHSNV